MSCPSKRLKHSKETKNVKQEQDSEYSTAFFLAFSLLLFLSREKEREICNNHSIFISLTLYFYFMNVFLFEYNKFLESHPHLMTENTLDLLFSLDHI